MELLPESAALVITDECNEVYRWQGDQEIAWSGFAEIGSR
jgi:hypothetical protein